MILCHQHGVERRRRLLRHGADRAAHPPAQAVCRHDLSRARRRRSRPEAHERDSGAVRRGPDGPADPDAARRARPGRIHGRARRRGVPRACSAARSTPWNTRFDIATRGIDLARDTHRANLALEDILGHDRPRHAGRQRSTRPACEPSSCSPAWPGSSRWTKATCGRGSISFAANVKSRCRRSRRLTNRPHPTSQARLAVAQRNRAARNPRPAPRARRRRRWPKSPTTTCRRPTARELFRDLSPPRRSRTIARIQRGPGRDRRPAAQERAGRSSTTWPTTNRPRRFSTGRLACGASSANSTSGTSCASSARPKRPWNNAPLTTEEEHERSVADDRRQTPAARN